MIECAWKAIGHCLKLTFQFLYGWNCKIGLLYSLLYCTHREWIMVILNEGAILWNQRPPQFFFYSPPKIISYNWYNFKIILETPKKIPSHLVHSLWPKKCRKLLSKGIYFLIKNEFPWATYFFFNLILSLEIQKNIGDFWGFWGD